MAGSEPVQVGGRFRIDSLLGEGGMGRVYLAEDTALRRRVALKFLTERSRDDSNAQRRLRAEARAAASIDHPFACKIFEVMEADGQDFVVMEYVEGPTLAERLAKGPLSTAEACRIVTEISEALLHAHTKGILHRDLKPSNIMLGPGDHVKVMDFGLAKQICTGADREAGATIEALTLSGQILGSPGYMSPEQLRGQPVGPASDIFSLGIVFFECLTGRNPFARATLADSMTATLESTPPPLPAAVDDELRSVVSRMLEKDASARFSSVAQLLDALKKSTNQFAPQRRRVRRPLAITITALVLITVAWTTWSRMDRGTSRVDLAEVQTRDREARALQLMENFSDPDDLELSIAIWEEILDARQDDPRALANLALARIQYAWNSAPDAQSLDRAQREAERAVLLDPNEAKAYSALTFLYLMRGMLDASKEMSQRSIEAGPDDPNVLQARARFLMDYAGNYAVAESLALRATEIDASCYPAWFQLGWARMEMGKFEEAEQSFQRAIDLRPDFGAARLGMGVCLSSERQFDEAVAAFDRALNVDPNSVQALYFQSIALSNLGMDERSLENSNHILISNPDHPLAAHAALNGALAARKLGLPDRSRELIAHAERTFKAAPQVGWSLLGRAGVACFHGDLDEADAWLRRAILSGFRSTNLMAIMPAIAPLTGREDVRGLVDDASIH